MEMATDYWAQTMQKVIDSTPKNTPTWELANFCRELIVEGQDCPRINRWLRMRAAMAMEEEGAEQ